MLKQKPVLLPSEWNLRHAFGKNHTFHSRHHLPFPFPVPVFTNAFSSSSHFSLSTTLLALKALTNFQASVSARFHASATSFILPTLGSLLLRTSLAFSSSSISIAICVSVGGSGSQLFSSPLAVQVGSLASVLVQALEGWTHRVELSGEE